MTWSAKLENEISRLRSVFLVPLIRLHFNEPNREKANAWCKQLATAGGRTTLRLHDPRVLWIYESLKADGMKNPILVFRTIDPDHYVVRLGHQRLAAARALGWTHCNAVVADGRDDVTATVDATYHQMTWDADKLEYRDG